MTLSRSDLRRWKEPEVTLPHNPHRNRRRREQPTMSREIDPDRIAAGDLDEDEVEYLRVRGKLPEGYLGQEVQEEGFAEGNAAAMTPRLKPRATPIDDQEPPRFSGGAIDDDGDDSDEDYEEGWNNNQRRAELAGRGLSTVGDKEALIGRLLRSDAEQLQDDDRA